MKREEIKKILEDITPEQLDAIMELSGTDIEREKKKREAIEAELKESKDFEGQGDNDILHALTKDDGKAFQGVTVVKLPGGTPRAESSEEYSVQERLAYKTL